jgi:hypothetical protein
MSNIDRIAELITNLRTDMREEVKSIITTEMTKFKGEMISMIDTKITDIKADLATHKVDIADKLRTITNDIGSLRTDFVTYTRQNTAVQEQSNDEYLYDYFTTNIGSSIFIKVIRYSITNSNGKDITELDGCILMNPLITGHTLTNISLSGFNIPVVDVKNIGNHIMRLTMLIESKHSLNTPKLNMKLRQALEFEALLASIDTIDMSKANNKFVKMVNNNNMRAYPKTVNMIFASDDISSYMVKFITDIYNGALTESSYNKHIIDNLIGDIFYRNLMTDNNIAQSEKDELKILIGTPDIAAIRAKCAAKAYAGRSKMLMEYILPFADVYSTIYLPMKKKIGILRFGKLIMKHLVNGANDSSTYKPLVASIGGAGAPKTRKRRSHPKKE